jgi:hypothetical protein
MRSRTLPTLGALLFFLTGAYGQVSPAARREPLAAHNEPQVRTLPITNPVFATGMKCDGATDDSAALQAALNSAAYLGLGNATVIMPPGTCIIDPGARVSISAGLWLQGAGRLGTTLKRKNGSIGNPIPMILINADGVTLSDFGFDGNKGGPGIVTSGDSVAADSPVSKLTIQRMRFANSTSSDVASYVNGTVGFPTDWLIADNDFDSQGNPFADCAVSFGCANLWIRQPLRLRIIGNRSDSSQNFAFFSSFPGGGQAEVGNNIITNLGGFGVALGGGVVGSAGANVHDNFIASNTTDNDNMIDLGFWNDFTVDHNTMHHNGIATGCIVDYPPANHGEVNSNICYASPTTLIDVGIGLGGSDISVVDNFVEGAGAAGISIAVSYAAPARGVRVIGNTAKNNGQNYAGHHAGIEFYLDRGSPNLAGLTDVIVRSNHCYDDQAIKTQGYGISFGEFGGNTTGFSNVLIEDNDFSGNLRGSVLNNATSFSGFVIRNNAGQNPGGVIPAPVFPSSGTALINTTGYDVTLYITSGTQPIAIAINGTTLAGVLVPGGGVGGPIRLPANQNITLTYAVGGAPSWQWVAD